MNSTGLAVVLTVGVVLGSAAAGAEGGEPWWQRGADRWYYKDDWQGLVLSGARACTKTCEVTGGAVGGWIVVWGGRGYTLSVNGRQVAASVDGCLIDDYDLSAFLKAGPKSVTLRIDGRTVCAEGELLGRDGKRHAFATGADWQAVGGGRLRARKKAVAPSTGAFHRAHNGRLMTYNDAERGKTAIARCLARIQRLNEQGIFLMRRLRPAEKVLSFDPDVDWRKAERAAASAVAKARAVLKAEAVPAQKAGRFKEAIAAAGRADKLVAAAERSVDSVTRGYPRKGHVSARSRRSDGRSESWTARLNDFPEDRFAWLNARELMGNDPAAWPFSVWPSACAYIDLAGQWDFRTDPDSAGLKAGWQSAARLGAGWRKIFAPRPWEKQGVRKDNLKSPGDCPYALPDARCGDKPYNGFAWYRKGVLVPAAWRGKKVILATGQVHNWARVFLNGKPLGEGRRNPPATQEAPADLLRFGKQNLIAVQVYNHDNFGGISGGPIALYVDGSAPKLQVTPGPMSYAYEYSDPVAVGAVQQTFLASAMSPGVILATDAPRLALWGWEAKGYKPPGTLRLVTDGGVRTIRLQGPADVAPDGKALAENWILLTGGDRDVLVVLERRPKSLAWTKGPLGAMGLVIDYAKGPVRAAVLVMQAGAKLNAARARFWARALRRYPVSAFERVRPDTAKAAPRLSQICQVGYLYYDLGGFGRLKPLTVAPVPMLFSYGLEHKYPGLKIDNARPTGWRSRHAAYLVVEDAICLKYRAPAVDRSKVMKGVGELFAKREARHNIRGGLSEDVMFRRMGEWGFDHCRYAWAFHANWDLPLVKFMGGPVLENNEAVWKRLDELVDKCNAAGMQMMLCWFFNEDQPQRDVGGAVRNSTRYWRARPQAQKNAFELWRRIAKRYADRPKWAISYDFFNEPAYMNTDHWNEVVKELTAVIRSVDKTHLIVWESADGWAQPFWCSWMQPADDPNVLYSFHHYGKHWGYAYDEYYPSYRNTRERTQIDHWLAAILFSIRHNVPIHCGEFGLSMIQPAGSGEAWLNDYLGLFERFGIGWNWWNYSGRDIYRTGLAAGDRISPYVPILRKWAARSAWGAARRAGD